MKFAKIVGLVILIISAVNAVPVKEVQKEQKDAKDEMVEISLNHEVEDNTTIDIDGDGTTPSTHFTEEVMEYFSQTKNHKMHNRVTRQNNEGALRHGCTVGLQSFVRNHWASCGGTVCGRHSCPLMQMTGNDWTNCWGQVFRIYRANGPGEILVGDLVGLYYPRQGGTWIGCAGSTCAKASCPGYPSTTHGFATEDNWYRCWGEVFRIYAKNKGLGATINSDDDVAFFYLQDQLWLALGYDSMVKYPCLGTSRPPPLSNYDVCAYETFQIWKN